MSIDKINPAQSDLISRIAAAQLRQPAKQGKPAVAVTKAGETAKSRQDAQLRKAAQDFEAIFLRQLLKSMRRTVNESSLWGDGREMELYRAMMDDEFAAEMARSGGIGLAEMLVEQLSPKGVSEK